MELGFNKGGGGVVLSFAKLVPSRNELPKTNVVAAIGDGHNVQYMKEGTSDKGRRTRGGDAVMESGFQNEGCAMRG